MTKTRHWALALTATGAIALAAPAYAQQGADFYKGKTVNYIVATAPGGGYDTYGRLVAEYMQKYLPGSTFVVRNMPGAGHVVGTNAIFASRPDGLTIGTFNTGLIYNQLIGLEGVRFDLTKMSWIGKAASDPRVFVVSQQSGINSFDDLRNSKTPVNMATAGVGSASYVETMMLANALRLPTKVLTGYNGSDDQLAMRRGEIQATIASRSTYEQFVQNGFGKLRTAYRKAMEDKELQEKAGKLERPVDPAYGEDVAKLVAEALDQTPDTIQTLKTAMTTQSAAPAAGAAAAPAATAHKGTVQELKNNARGIVIKLDDGKTFEAEISGSRTEITIAGQKAERTALKAGQTCTVDAPSAGAEAKSIVCQ
jgi:tripartite-type tricarboxylate transporter receptor subunit TctC